MANSVSDISIVPAAGEGEGGRGSSGRRDPLGLLWAKTRRPANM